MKTVYLIRHGEIEAGNPRRFIGRTDLHLTQHGRAQIDSLGNHLATAHIETVFCSPLSRCRQSAEILGCYSRTTVRVCEDLAEIDLGEWEGLTVSEVKQRFPDGYEERGKNLCGYTPLYGESFANLQKRVVAVFFEILEQTKRTSAVVAHAGVNRVLLCNLLGVPLSNMFQLNQSYGCYNRILIDSKGLRLDCLNCLP